MRIRENLGGLVAATSKPKQFSNKIPKPQVGRVFGVILDENTPSKELFEKNGGWSGIGTVFYLDYEASKNLKIEEVNLSTCKTAVPNLPIQDYPLIGELIIVLDGGPSPVTQIQDNKGQKYYTSILNVWNNIQQNAPGVGELGKYFVEDPNIRRLYHFEGDRIIQGRKGNGIRFGSTVKLKSNINEWSKIGNDGDPITIMVNGYVTTNTSSLISNIEEINKEKSSIYMTSTQAIPLIPGSSIVNPQTFTIKPKDYSYSQIILNSDRVTLNSKKDEVLLFAKTNIELNTDNIINLNAKQITHINSDFISLGTDSDGTYASEPVLLGCVTNDIIIDLCNALKTIAGYLAKATVPTSEGAVCITDCNVGGTNLLTDLENILDRLQNEENLSKKVYTS